MIILNLMVILVFIIGIFIGNKKYKNVFREVDKKENILKFLYPFCFFIYEKFNLKNYNKKSISNLRKILIKNDKELNQIYIIQFCKKLSVCIFVILISNILSICVNLTQNKTIQNEINLERNNAGYGEKEYKLNINLNNENEQISFVVSEKEYTNEELEQEFDYVFKYIEENLKGENDSLDNVYLPLNLIEDVNDSAIKIEWQIEDYNLIDTNGNILFNEEIKKPVITNLIAILSYKNEKREQIYPIQIVEKAFTEKEKILNDVKKELEYLDENNRYDLILNIPNNINGIPISENKNESNLSLALLFIGIIISILLFFKDEEDLKNKIKDRNLKLKDDYAVFVNKLVLLLGAGMTISSAISKIALDYKNNNKERRYLYEELLVTHYEIKAGVGERQAYYNLSRRINISSYSKLITLIIQNLTKGSNGLLDLLEREEQEAFNLKKENTKRLGEEASTKLLIPMLLLLLVVMAIIIFPAFLSFNI